MQQKTPSFPFRRQPVRLRSELAGATGGKVVFASKPGREALRFMGGLWAVQTGIRTIRVGLSNLGILCTWRKAA